MTNLKPIKRSLISSVSALLVCFSMFLGTTFAWFTDSVTSANNIITAGNLDVELYHSDSKVTDEKVTSTTKLFDDVDSTKWEPGAMAWEKFTVKNEGSLDLKYSLTLNALNATEIDNVSFADMLKVAFVEADFVYNRDNVKALDASKWTTLETFTLFGDLHENEQDVYGVVIWWEPSAQDNLFNMKDGNTTEVKVEVGVNLLATQLTSEEDSFGKDYDYATPWLGKIPASLDETSLEIVPGGGTQTGTITVNSAEDLVYLKKHADEWVATYSNGQGTNVGSYRENVGGKGTDYYYHWAWDIKLAVDLDMNNVPMDSIDITYWGNFDGQGHTISNVVLKDGQDGLFLNGAKAINNLTVKNIKVNAPEENTVGAVSGNGAMTNVHVENATVIGNKYVGGICGKGSSFVNCSIKDSTVIGNDKTVGGLVGYSIGDPDPATVTSNLVENVTVTGAYNVGGLLGQAQNETVEGNTVKNVKIFSALPALPDGADSTEKLAVDVAARIVGATTIGTNEVINVTIDTAPVTPKTLQAFIDAAEETGNYEIELTAGTYENTIYMKSDIILKGVDGAVVHCINLNGAANVTLQNITFDAAGAKGAYDFHKGGTRRTTANILTGDEQNTGKKGARGLVIDGCTFKGTFANGGAAIAFPDRNRTSGQSGDITIQNCTFKTTNAYYDIYTYYSGYGELNIINNTFASECQGKPIYLGKYQSSTPVVVTGNTFENVATFADAAYLQDHGSYGVSFAATNVNTFNG